MPKDQPAPFRPSFRQWCARLVGLSIIGALSERRELWRKRRRRFSERHMTRFLSIAICMTAIVWTGLAVMATETATFSPSFDWTRLSRKNLVVRTCYEITRPECEELARQFLQEGETAQISPTLVAPNEQADDFAEIIPRCLWPDLDDLLSKVIPQQASGRATGPFARYDIPVGAGVRVAGLRGYRARSAEPGQEYGWAEYILLDAVQCRYRIVSFTPHDGNSRTPITAYTDGVVQLNGRPYVYSIYQLAPNEEHYRVTLYDILKYDLESDRKHIVLSFSLGD